MLLGWVEKILRVYAGVLDVNASFLLGTAPTGRRMFFGVLWGCDIEY